MTEFKDLVGRRKLDYAPIMNVNHPFDGDAQGVAFGLDGVTYLVFEDPSDGYRSSASPILSFAGSPYELGGNVWPEYFHDTYVIVEDETVGKYSGENDVLVFRSESSGEVIFRIGTENVDDYYPSFVAYWKPVDVRK